MDWPVILTGAFFAACFLFFVIREAAGRRKGRDSQEKRQIQELGLRLIPNGGAYTMVYAYSKRMEAPWGGRRVTTCYGHYGVAFRPGELYVIPIIFAGDQISSGEPLRFTPSQLGRVEGSGEKATLYGRDGGELLSLWVSAGNTRDGMGGPVNIQQKEEAEAFQAFLEDFARQVNGGPGPHGRHT